MEKVLKLYTYIDGVNDTPFPSESLQVLVTDFRCDYKRMGGAPTISCSVMHPNCLDKLWTYNVYALFNGERFFIKQIPTSSYDNTDFRYKHELELVSERIILDNVYFYDVVDSEADFDKPVSNSSSFAFFGDIHEFAERLNESLAYSKVGYSVVVDDGISSEAKLLSFQDQFFTNVLQEIYNTYEIPYYFTDKVIHIGFTDNAITDVFKYGQDESLLSIQKQNANYKIVNRVTGVGSADNIPYYYPNFDNKGVTNALYNKESGNVNITNKSKYNKIKLNDVISYNSVKADDISLLNNSVFSDISYTFTDKESQQVIEFSYKFTISEESKILFRLSSTYDNTDDLSCDLYNSSNQVIGSFKNGNIKEALPKGSYTMRVIWNLVALKILNEEFAKELVMQYISVNAIVIGGTNYWWALNGKRINLDDYGLSLNVTPKVGDEITIQQVSYLKPQQNLMPTIYRDTNGNERFYNALNETYKSPQTGDFYSFENPYIDGKPKEHIVNFEDIKPTIVGMTNSEGLRIDMFSDFAFDANDNDEFDEEGNYLHPYFFGKLRKFDGEYGFNLFDHAIEESEMVISMTSGSCGACEFIIGVDDETQKNLVQVDDDGNLLRDEDGNVRCGRQGIQMEVPQDKQNDTINNEVWIALKKDQDTFGVLMPNAENKYRPQAGDTFVILHIDLPTAYVLSAEDKLKEELIKYMALNNSEKFNFSISFSRIFFAENPNILAKLNENARIQIEYDNERYELYVSSFSYSMASNTPLPEIRVELQDTLTITQNTLQNAISEVKHDIMSSVGSIDFLKQGLKYFLRKDTNDRTSHVLASDEGFEVGKFKEGTLGSGGAMYMRDGSSYSEVDFLKVRKKATFTEITVQELRSIGGELAISPAYMICSKVEETEDGYKCYFNTTDSDGRRVYNQFVVGDQARCQTFGLTNNNYYWRLVIESDFDKDYIVLSKDDCDKNSGIPQEGDNISLVGNRTNEERQSVTILSAYGADAPSIKMYKGVGSGDNPWSLEEHEVTKLSPYGNHITGVLNIEKGSKGWENFEGLPEEIQKAASATDILEDLEYGKNNMLRNSGFTGDYLTAVLDGSTSLKDTSSMFSPSLKHWDYVKATAIEEKDYSESGKAVQIQDGGIISQTLYFKVIKGEKYIFSFRGKGGNVTYSIGGHTYMFELTDEWSQYVDKFTASNEGTIFTLNVTGNCTLCELQLERGTVKSAWGISPLDNRSELAKYDSLTYLQAALKGETDILGGLINTNLINMGMYDEESKMIKTTAGINGLYNEDRSIAFWAGGNSEQAVFTEATYLDNPNYIPTQEELNKMAKFVVTHGGRAILNDIILRGYIYALGGFFKGEVVAEKGSFKNINSESDAFSIDKNGVATLLSGKIGKFRVDENFIGSRGDDKPLGLDGKMAMSETALAFNGDISKFFIDVNPYSESGKQHVCNMIFNHIDDIFSNKYIEFNIQGSTKGNFAFSGKGDGVLNGLQVGYGVRTITGTANTTEIIQDIHGGNNFIVVNDVNVGLPSYESVHKSLGIESGNFCVPVRILNIQTSEIKVQGKSSSPSSMNSDKYPVVDAVFLSNGECKTFYLVYNNGTYRACVE